MKTKMISLRASYPCSIRRSALSAMEFINKDISNHILLKQLANKTGTNECTLKKIFKNIYSTTVYQFLLKKRMEHADYLLQTTHLKIKEIAIQCGYESSSGFITTFRKYFGTSPGELRKKWCYEISKFQSIN